ncbi:MAG: hypothetical protein JWL61_1093 [Gemmatimonadetes bacterium]|nr:hypothetical protein [Gemmatimonadota bacterium]
MKAEDLTPTTFNPVDDGPAPDPNNPEAGPFGRPFATVRALAGFMTEKDLVGHVPNIFQQNAHFVAQMRERLGRATMLSHVPEAGRPRFFQVNDARVLRLLDRVAELSATAPTLDNLVGFEWVEIAPIVTGRLVTGHEPSVDVVPHTSDPSALARFCMLSAPDVPPIQIDVSTLTAISLVALNAKLIATGIAKAIDADGVTIIGINAQLRLQAAIDPIRLLIVGGRTVALSGIERLVALAHAGANRALCSVSYGYGVDALAHFPTVEREVIDSPRPPMIVDFLDSSLSVRLPARIQRTVITASIAAMSTG